MKLKVLALGLALGIVWGVGIFLITLLTVLKGGGMHLALLSAVYFGYKVSWLGSIIGLCWGFVNGLVVGIVVAWIYNLFVKEPAK